MFRASLKTSTLKKWHLWGMKFLKLWRVILVQHQTQVTKKEEHYPRQPCLTNSPWTFPTLSRLAWSGEIHHRAMVTRPLTNQKAPQCIKMVDLSHLRVRTLTIWTSFGSKSSRTSSDTTVCLRISTGPLLVRAPPVKACVLARLTRTAWCPTPLAIVKIAGRPFLKFNNIRPWTATTVRLAPKPKALCCSQAAQVQQPYLQPRANRQRHWQAILLPTWNLIQPRQVDNKSLITGRQPSKHKLCLAMAHSSFRMLIRATPTDAVAYSRSTLSSTLVVREKGQCSKINDWLTKWLTGWLCVWVYYRRYFKVK